MRIRQIKRPPPQDIPAAVDDFLRHLGGPCWIDVPGRDSGRRRMVVSLLHGNEPSSIRAVHAWLRNGHEPSVDVCIYVGSVTAALAPPGFAYRSLPGERDANRCYGPVQDDLQGQIAAEFTALFQGRSFEALIDLHNNTGHNPAYGIGYGLDNARLNLCSLFADWYVLSDLRLNTLVEMSQRNCPSISIECGRAGDPAADAAALAGLDRFLHLESLELDQPASRALSILRHPRRVCLASDIAVEFGPGPMAGLDLTLRDDLDRQNFKVLPAGTVLGWLRPGLSLPLCAEGPGHTDLTDQLFDIQAGELRTATDLIPIMMTNDVAVARSDCLFYAIPAE